MNRIFLIALITALVLSLAGNFFLGFSLSNETKIANTLNIKLNDTKKELSKSQDDFQTTSKDLKKKTDDYKELNLKYNEAYLKLGRVMCSVVIPADTVKSASTNNALIDPITKAEEAYYAASSVNSTFAVVWNNTKTAIFTITWPKNETSKVLVSWGFDTNKVQAIFNIGDGCLYYLP